MTTTNLQEKIETERANARAVCNTDGATNAECAAAWDAVEELQAEAAHKKNTKTDTNSLQKYCDENPDAVECRIYED